MSLKTFLASAILVISGLSAQAYRSDDSKVEITLPLNGGRLNLRDVVSGVAQKLGFNGSNIAKDVDWSIDVNSILGKIELNLLDRLADDVISTQVRNDSVIVEVDSQQLQRRMAESARSVEGWIGELTGSLLKRQQRPYGITFVTLANERATIKEVHASPKRIVLLIHGLDDPGFMWRDLIPELLQREFVVARFEYPNDGPISESTDLLASCLAELRKAGVEHVDIVAHSMGGLVTRDVLSRPAYYAGDGRGSGKQELPSIDRLVMLGTPNHGSKFARLRGLMELREHFYRAWQGEEGWLSGFDADGAGAAGVDLLPDSDFLRRLNSRTLAAHTKYTIVAGECGTELADDMKKAMDKARKFAACSSAPRWLRDMLAAEHERTAVTMVGQTFNELGDGCVDVESARLNGVEDFQIVAGNHLSMVVNVAGVTRQQRMPPAIPIILDRLSQSR